MPKLSIEVQYEDITLNTQVQAQKALLNIASVIMSEISPSTLISSDPDNDLQLGSDGKLLSQPLPDNNAPDFLAIYLLARG